MLTSTTALRRWKNRSRNKISTFGNARRSLARDDHQVREKCCMRQTRSSCVHQCAVQCRDLDKHVTPRGGLFAALCSGWSAPWCARIQSDADAECCGSRSCGRRKNGRVHSGGASTGDLDSATHVFVPHAGKHAACCRMRWRSCTRPGMHSRIHTACRANAGAKYRLGPWSCSASRCGRQPRQPHHRRP